MYHACDEHVYMYVEGNDTHVLIINSEVALQIEHT